VAKEILNMKHLAGRMGPPLVCIGPTSLGRRKKEKKKHWNHTGRRKEKGVEDT
jgi:hypothetical protein